MVPNYAWLVYRVEVENNPLSLAAFLNAFGWEGADPTGMEDYSFLTELLSQIGNGQIVEDTRFSYAATTSPFRAFDKEDECWVQFERVVLTMRPKNSPCDISPVLRFVAARKRRSRVVIHCQICMLWKGAELMRLEDADEAQRHARGAVVYRIIQGAGINLPENLSELTKLCPNLFQMVDVDGKGVFVRIAELMSELEYQRTVQEMNGVPFLGHLN